LDNASWINLAQDSEKSGVFLNTIMEVQVRRNAGDISSGGTISFSRTLLRGIR